MWTSLVERHEWIGYVAASAVVVTALGACAEGGATRPIGGAGGIGGIASGGTPGTSGGTPGTGSAMGSGGLPTASGGMLGSVGTGGESSVSRGGALAGDAGACVPHTGDPVIDPAAFPACDSPALAQCTDGHCVPAAAVPAESAALLADCQDGSKCVPAAFIATNNAFVPNACRSLDDAEGRCLSLCVPQIAEQASFLTRDTCTDTELCAPCYDPRNGEPTGACSQGCDEGPTESPVVFDRCCGTLGSCVPTTAVPEADRGLLGIDTCTGSDRLCAPDDLAASTFVPPTCVSVAGAEGRCLPACIPQVADQADRLPADTCTDGNLCAPCYDPFTGESTSACERNRDAPMSPPATFAECCGGLGACVPRALVPAEQQSLLGTDDCTDGDVLCAPLTLTEPGARPRACRSFGRQNREGRCLPACIPQVAERADQLVQEDCETGELCTPCYDPVGGGATGACEINGDASVDADPGTFTVCGALNVFCPTCTPVDGRCVPTYIVPTDQAGLLPVPAPAPCATEELCAPCVNPLDSVPTGACP